MAENVRNNSETFSERPKIAHFSEGAKRRDEVKHFTLKVHVEEEEEERRSVVAFDSFSVESRTTVLSLLEA
jgi:hypothetical protein